MPLKKPIDFRPTLTYLYWKQTVMNRLITPLAGLFLTAQVFSQDILTMRSGSKYEVKLLEITDTQIRFKMFNNPDGPDYNISRSSFASIRYENGFEEVFAQQPSENPETVAINGFNTSATPSGEVPQPPLSASAGNDPPVTTREVEVQKRTTFGDVLGAILFTGVMALDIAAKVDAHASKCAQHHSHSQSCR
jgi:hypothetical protein